MSWKKPSTLSVLLLLLQVRPSSPHLNNCNSLINLPFQCIIYLFTNICLNKQSPGWFFSPLIRKKKRTNKTKHHNDFLPSSTPRKLFFLKTQFSDRSRLNFKTGLWCLFFLGMHLRRNYPAPPPTPLRLWICWAVYTILIFRKGQNDN